MQITEELHPGMEVIAGHEAIGELLETFAHGDVKYLHVRRFGPGLDDLYIPSIAVATVAPKHIYLAVASEELLGQSWHEHPGRDR